MAATGCLACNLLSVLIIFTLIDTCSGETNTATKAEESSTNQGSWLKDRHHVEDILQLYSPSIARDIVRSSNVNAVLAELVGIYQSAIKPLENKYKYQDMAGYHITDGDISAKPLILFIGPWSTGKSSIINYLLNIEDSPHKLRTGAEPTTSDFHVMMHGEQNRTVEGMVLAADKTKGFSSLEKYGQGFLEKLTGVELENMLLEHVIMVDTPGIIENRKQQERGYPYYDVMKWFIDRADLICIVFDHTKLDVGLELELLFKQLKGHQSKIRIILNKADSLATQELMRVYGALFWSLAPLINVTEPPRVYTGSFWGRQMKEGTSHQLFLSEEMSLLHDLRESIQNQLENRIAFIRKHAIRVRIHALLVNSYLAAFNSKYSLFGDAEVLLHQIVDEPKKFHIYQAVLALPLVSKYDLPDPDKYREFFSIYALNTFKTLESHCSVFYGCPMENLLLAIQEKLPKLLSTIERHGVDACSGDFCPPETIEPPVESVKNTLD